MPNPKPITVTIFQGAVVAVDGLPANTQARIRYYDVDDTPNLDLPREDDDTPYTETPWEPNKPSPKSESEKLPTPTTNISATVQVGNWNVCSCVDDDGHLNVYVTNAECDTIGEIETGQGNGEGEQYATRYTTDRIESDYEANQA
jgi:hypothetical protein